MTHTKPYTYLHSCFSSTGFRHLFCHVIIRMAFSISLTALLTMPGTPLFAATQAAINKPLQSHESIRSAAVEYVRSQIPEGIKIQEIKAGKLDSRIRFRECSEALQVRSSMNRNISSHWTINVRCDAPVAWNIYIPVKTTLLQKMLVSRTTITRGEIITRDKLKLTERVITSQNQKYFSNLKDVVGRQARRSIRPDRVINSSMLQEAYLVHKKEPVLIYAQNQKIRISVKGTALKNGKYNDIIRVRNNSSKKIIDAVVVDRGVVAINF